jgi:histone-arginine methyltransferase CARM1
MEQGLFRNKYLIKLFIVRYFSSQVWLSTAPTQPLTHWYQVRCLFMKPLTVNQGKTIKGHAILHSNRKYIYKSLIFLI